MDDKLAASLLQLHPRLKPVLREVGYLLDLAGVRDREDLPRVYVRRAVPAHIKHHRAVRVGAAGLDARLRLGRTYPGAAVGAVAVRDAVVAKAGVHDDSAVGIVLFYHGDGSLAHQDVVVAKHLVAPLSPRDNGLFRVPYHAVQRDFLGVEIEIEHEAGCRLGLVVGREVGVVVVMRGQRDLVNGVLFDPDFMLVAEVRAGAELEVTSINALRKQTVS